MTTRDFIFGDPASDTMSPRGKALSRPLFALVLLSASVLASGRRARFFFHGDDTAGTDAGAAASRGVANELVEVLPAVCKVADEVELEEHPECVLGDAFSAFGSADTTTCGFSTRIPAEKLAATTCTDAQSVLDAHNRMRARRGAQPLIWANTLAQSAKEVATRCEFAPSGTDYGEAIAWGRSMTCDAATALWISQEENYDVSNPGYSSATGHFTQAAWKSTTQVGCYIASCGTGDAATELAICHYNPPGNVLSSFGANVGADGEPSPCYAIPPVPPVPPLDPSNPIPPIEPIPPIGQLPGIDVPLPGLPPGEPCCIAGFCAPYLC